MTNVYVWHVTLSVLAWGAAGLGLRLLPGLAKRLFERGRQ